MVFKNFLLYPSDPRVCERDL